MTIRTQLRQWFRDLFTPIGDEPVIPATPKPIGKVLLGQVIVTEVIGHNAPLIDKAAFIASPHIVQAAARWGADRGSATYDTAIDGAIDVDGWRQ